MGVSSTPLPPAPIDTDRDSIIDSLDNCPIDSNRNQLDTDKDGLGDVCDPTPNIIPVVPASKLEAIDDAYSTNKAGPVYRVNVLTNDRRPTGVTLAVKEINDVAGSNGGVFSLDVDGALYFEPNGSFNNLSPTGKNYYQHKL